VPRRRRRGCHGRRGERNCLSTRETRRRAAVVEEVAVGWAGSPFGKTLDAGLVLQARKLSPTYAFSKGYGLLWATGLGFAGTWKQPSGFSG
jgi:hypothetical protein